VKLDWSDEAEFFAARNKDPAISPEELRGALRFILGKTNYDPNLVAQVSNINFNAVTNAGVALDRSKESLGNSIQREAQATTYGLPNEKQTFSVRLYRNPDLDVRYPLECILDPDVAKRQWRLKPLDFDDFVELSVANVLNRIEDGLEGAGVDVFEGEFKQTPNP